MILVHVREYQNTTHNIFLYRCSQILGNTQEAFEFYTNVIKRNLADESSLAVATNNLIALKGPKDVANGLRKLDKPIEKGEGPQIFQLARGLDLKLSRKQREAIFTSIVCCCYFILIRWIRSFRSTYLFFS
ncbi:signal recognition particle subunit SRP72-like [Olea europaea subsp. europaea]|uniref:Signal recognition particle subunit SRP72-like n=1 Tax=Olea europaea subsp. europaea TaxID=158383 RepID=A0A8S0RFU1_OLEEU|nr:signal recognition particle subunit SRP72-like [Olea europaea subsp. europaea]